MSQGIIDLLKSVQINEVNGAHIVRPPFVERLLHAVAQSRAIGEAGQSIKSRQMVDLSFANLSRGNILNKNDHPSVLHCLNCEFKRPRMKQLNDKTGVATARKPGIETVDQDLRVGLGNQTCIDTTFHHMMQT